MEGRWLSKCGARLSAAHTRLHQSAKASRAFSRRGSRLRAARIRPNVLKHSRMTVFKFDYGLSAARTRL
eukprot:4999957-Pyramimonas_sp.AAC.1